MGPGHRTVAIQQARETLLYGSVGAGENSVEDGLTVGLRSRAGEQPLPFGDGVDRNAEVLGEAADALSQRLAQSPGFQAGPLVHGGHVLLLSGRHGITSREEGGAEVEQKWNSG
ncbi:hypothetical protein ACWGQ9_05110 [Streptomyces parvus]